MFDCTFAYEIVQSEKGQNMFSSIHEDNGFSAIEAEELETINGGFWVELLGGIGIGLLLGAISGTVKKAGSK